MKNDYITEIHKKDKLLIHPYEDFETKGSYDRKLILKSNNIFVFLVDVKILTSFHSFYHILLYVYLPLIFFFKIKVKIKNMLFFAGLISING